MALNVTNADGTTICDNGGQDLYRMHLDDIAEYGAHNVKIFTLETFR